MIQYGLISKVDSQVLEKTIELIHQQYGDGYTYVTEIGCYGGCTANGLKQYVERGGAKLFITGIDNNKDGEEIRFKYDNLIIGNSHEVYNQLEDNSHHLIFVDGCHCFAHVVSDFFCYAPKIKKGGYFAFHDTGKHIKPFKDFQHGGKENPDAYISVRKALVEVGLFKNVHRRAFEPSYIGNEKWELIFDEADETNEAGGICVFKKLY